MLLESLMLEAGTTGRSWRADGTIQPQMAKG